MDDLNFQNSYKEIKDEFAKIWDSKNMGEISNANELGFYENQANSMSFLGFEEPKTNLSSMLGKKEESDNEDLGKMWVSNPLKVNDSDCYYSPKKSHNNLEAITPFTSDKKPKGGRSAKGITLIFFLGLRVLSMKVRDIVYEKKSTTYKQVAEELIKTGMSLNNWTENFPLDNVDFLFIPDKR